MSNHWLRLWHDMPNDPKWRTVARAAGEPISLVQAVFMHMLVDASQNVTRGHTHVTDEDLASALDCDELQIKAIRDAMQARVLDGDSIKGWDKRQPKREDAGNPETGAKSASQRKREQRERERQLQQEQQCHEVSHKVTTDKDTDTEKEITPLVANATPVCPHDEIIKIYHEELPTLPQVRAWTPKRRQALQARWREDSERQDLTWWRAYFQYVSNCDFLMGRVTTNRPTPFLADLEWLVTQSNFVKVIEGKYEGNANAA